MKTHISTPDIFVADRQVAFASQDMAMLVKPPDGTRLVHVANLRDNEYFLYEYYANNADRTVPNEEAFGSVWGTYNRGVEEEGRVAQKEGRAKIREINPDLAHINTGAFMGRQGLGVMALSRMDVRFPWLQEGDVFSFLGGTLQVHDLCNLARIKEEGKFRIVEDLSASQIKILKALGKSIGKTLTTQEIHDASGIKKPANHFKDMETKIGPAFREAVVNVRGQGYMGVA